MGGSEWRDAMDERRDRGLEEEGPGEDDLDSD